MRGRAFGRASLFLGLLACAGEPTDREVGDELPVPVEAGSLDGKVSSALHERVAAGQAVTAIVTLDEQRSEASARLAVGDLASPEAAPLLDLRREDYRLMKGRALAAPGIRVVRELVELPTAVIEVDSPEALAALAASPDVLTVQPEGTFTPQMTESIQMIGAYDAQSGWGYAGAGVTVAVLDTGLDYTLSNFGSCAAPAGACTHGACDTGGALVSTCDPCVTSICVTNPGCCSGSWDASCVAAVATTCSLSCNNVNPGADFDVEAVGGGTCGVAVARDFAPFDAHREDTTTQFARHGTAVGDVIHAIAPSAKIAALDVFREGSTSVLESDVLAALDWVMTNRATYNIRVVNLSFGSGAFTSPCPTHNLAASIDALRTAGVLSVAASGNDGRTDALMGPACIPSVLSVGAVYDSGPQVQPTFHGCSDAYQGSDSVPCFSNAAPFMDLVAPGSQIFHTGFTVNQIVSSSTSMASAHAAGAAAQVAAGFSFETPSDWQKRLQYGGPFAYDYRNGRQYPRLHNVGAVTSCALGTDTNALTFDFLGGPAAVAVDVVPASCQFQVNIYDPWIRVAGAGGGSVPPQGTCGHSLCSTRNVYDPSWALANGCTSCVTSICAADPWCCSSGWDSACANAVQTRCPPSTCGGGGGGTVLTGAQTVNLTVDAGFTARYGYVYFQGFGAYWNDYVSMYQDFTKGGPQVQAFAVNGGATYATTPVASVTSTVVDGTLVESMCVSSTPACSAWQAYVSPRSVGLSAGDGTKTVYAKFRDDFGNESVQVSDTIVMDTTPPVNGTLTAVPSSGRVVLTWSGFSDATSGLATYKLVYQVGSTAPSSCATGTSLLPAGAGVTTTTYTHAGLIDGTFYSYRVCATDNAGKTSTGASITSRPAPEFTPPTGGGVTIAGGASFTATGVVSLGFTASDPSGMGSVCVNQTGLTCTSWVAYPATSSMSYTLAAGPGQKTVYVWFRDRWNNQTTTAVTDTILLDVQQAAVSAVGTDGRITVTWATASGTPLGADAWYLNKSLSTMASCAAGTNIYQGPNNSFVDTVPNDGALVYYRICLRAFGTLSAGREVSARAKPESAPPTGTVVISGTPAPGTTYVSSTAVTLTITATDASAGAIQMCVSNSTTCTAWEALAGTKAWTLATGSGTKTVRVFLRDVFFNTTTSAQAATDTIVLDTTAPTNGTLTATATAGRVALSWSGQTDALSGVAAYKLVAQPTSAPASCAVGTVIQDWGASMSAAHSGLAAGTTWGYRVCTRDTLGNTSVGAVRTATVP